jgi:serine/threonine-protein kinase
MAEQPTAVSADHDTPPPPAETPVIAPVVDTSSLRPPTQAAEESSGVAYGRYALLRTHAQGGLGKVSLAKDTKLGRTVALKEIRPDRQPSPEALQRFVNEAAITGLLEHPGIVPIYSLDEDADGKPYYAMRFIEGQSLKAALEAYHAQPTAATFRKLLQNFIAVCNAVAFAHSKGVIHRDLKPENIMLGEYGETLVVDWGLAKLFSRPGQLDPGTRRPGDKEQEVSLSPGLRSAPAAEIHTHEGSVLGTPGYMAPEQARGEIETLGPAADIYALGGILYALLTGHAPYQGNLFDILQQQQRGIIPPLPSVEKPATPKALEAVCFKALAAQPQERYATATALAADVEHWLGDEPTSAYAEPWTTKTRRWLRRHRTLSVSGVLLLLAAVAVVVAVAVVRAEMSEQARRDLEVEQKKVVQALHEEQIANQRGQQVIETLVSDEQLKFMERQLGLTPEQEQLLRLVVAYYQDYVRKTAAVTTADQVRQVEVYHRLGEMQRQLGMVEEALVSFDHALRLSQALLEKQPYDADRQEQLAQCWYYVASMQATTGRTVAAERSLRSAIALLTPLVARFPLNGMYRRELAKAWNNLAIRQEIVHRLTDAENSVRTAITLLRQVTPTEAKVPETRYRLASALHDMGRILLSQGKFRDAEKYLEEGRLLCAALMTEFPTDPNYKHHQGIILNSLALLQRQTGRHQTALINLQQALRLREELAVTYPAVTSVQWLLSNTWSELGDLQLTLNMAHPAQASYEKARAVLEKLTAAKPGVPEYQYRLGGLWRSVGHLHQQRKEFTVAVSCYQKALQIHQQLAQTDPACTSFTEQVAATLKDLAMVHAAMGQYDQVKENTRQGLALLDQLPATARQDLGVQVVRAYLYVQQANAAREQNRLPEALEGYAQAVATLQTLPAQAAAVGQVQDAWENAHAGRARTLQRLNRHAEALTAWETALKHIRQIDPLALCPDHQLGRATCLAALGDHANAAKQLKVLSTGILFSRGYADADLALVQVGMARTYAHCAELAAQATGSSPEDRQKWAQQYASQAVALLKQAKDKGHFRNPKHVEALTKDAAFAPLRDLPAFQQLLRELAGHVLRVPNVAYEVQSSTG